MPMTIELEFSKKSWKSKRKLRSTYRKLRRSETETSCSDRKRSISSYLIRRRILTG